MFFVVGFQRAYFTTKLFRQFGSAEILRQLPEDFPKRYRWFGAHVVEAHALSDKEKEFQLCLYRLERDGLISIPHDINAEPWTNLDKHLFHKKGATLTTCAKEFLDLHRRYANPTGAYANCWYASNEFLGLLLQRNVFDQNAVNTRKISIRGLPFPPKRGRWHAWFQAGGIVIDWTYRQFDAASPFPLICNEKNYPFHTEIVDWTKGFPQGV